MSVHVPFDIQVEIIKRVHLVKSLLRFRSVSNQYKSLIDSSEFIAHHSVNYTQPHHLLVTYKVDSEYKYVSFVDDDSFPLQKFVTNVPTTINVEVHTLDSSHGLVCLYGHEDTFSVVLWNPSIRKSVGIVLPVESDIVGFGVCPKTCDPKIVAMAPREGAMRPVRWEAQVFTLSSRAWRSVSINVRMPLMWVVGTCHQVIIDGVVHWLVYDSINESREMILSFDLTSEEFGQVHLPDILEHDTNYISISKCKESLVLLGHDKDKEICHVWMMTKNGDLEYSFAKLYTVSFHVYDGCRPYDIIGFTKDGQLIREYQHRSGSDDSVVTTLEANDPSTESSRDLGISVDSRTHYMMTPYKESLLLLNHYDSIIR